MRHEQLYEGLFLQVHVDLKACERHVLIYERALTFSLCLFLGMFLGYGFLSRSFHCCMKMTII